jgi:hypothetical protein
MFVIVITVAIGYGLKQVNSASSIVKEEKFIYQSSIIVEDVLTILKTSPDIARAIDTNSSSDFYVFMSQASFIPLQISGFDIVLKISSARAKFNPKQLNAQNIDLMRIFMSNHNVNSQYVDILVDSISGIKEDNSYNSTIFDENPYLFRNYIASFEQVKEINKFYTKEYNDPALENIDFKELFYFSDESNISIDLNYATPVVWELLLGTTKERAEFLSDGMGSYTAVEDLNLDRDEEENLAKFKTSYFEPFLFVEIEIMQENMQSKISFEYDIKKKEGYNFAYEIS